MPNPASPLVEPRGPGRQANHEQSDGDPILGYCRQLEVRIALQSAEIEALRQMIKSEHDRHARVSLPQSENAARHLNTGWLRQVLVAAADWVRPGARSTN